MKVVITTGGTGGHIYPALSLANALKKDDIDTSILFIGTENHMESTIIPQAGYDFYGIKAEGLSGSRLDKLRKALKLVISSNKLKRKLKEFKPDIVIGFGGYASVPAIVAAKRLRIPTVIHEQNSYPGKANLFLGKFVDAVVVCYEQAFNAFNSKKTYYLGNPRASEVLSYKKNPDLIASFGLSVKKQTILIVMGSQGSESVNGVVIDSLKKMQDKEYQVIYVTGKNHYQEVLKKTKESDNIKIVDYVDQGQLLSNIDLIVARGGATTAAEITAVGVPSIIIPSPYVPNNHQVVNAISLVDVGAAVMIEEKDLTAENLVTTIDSLLSCKDSDSFMKKKALEFSSPSAAEDIIHLMKELVYKDE